MRRPKEINYALIILCLCVLIGPTIAVFLWKIFDTLDESTVQFLAGATFTALVFTVATGCLSLFIIVYSRLRRTEEHEDDMREIMLLRTQKEPPVAVNVQQPFPFDQSSSNDRWRPGVLAPLIDYREDVELG